MKWKIELTEPSIGQEENDAVLKVLQNKWLTMGKVTASFEKEFAAKMNVKYAFAVSNCTAALHLSNLVLGISSGDEVICPALTFVATANATRYIPQAKIVFADVLSEHDLTISPKDIEAKITPKTKAITVVHYAGFPCLMDEIMEIASKHKLKVIEDCAHAPFAWYKFKDGCKKYVGSIGDLGCFSFYGNKNMTTGEGGMVTTNDEKLAEKIRLLRSHGMTSLTYERHKGHASDYDVTMLGYNYRMDEIRSAIGLTQLKKIDILNEKRRQVYQWYLDIFAGYHNAIIPFSQRNIQQSTCHIMPVIFKDGYDEIKQNLRNAGIQTSKHYDLISNFSNYRQTDIFQPKFTAKNMMTLPLSPFISYQQVKFIFDVINNT